MADGDAQVRSSAGPCQLQHGYQGFHSERRHGWCRALVQRDAGSRAPARHRDLQRPHRHLRAGKRPGPRGALAAGHAGGGGRGRRRQLLQPHRHMRTRRGDSPRGALAGPHGQGWPPGEHCLLRHARPCPGEARRHPAARARHGPHAFARVGGKQLHVQRSDQCLREEGGHLQGREVVQHHGQGWGAGGCRELLHPHSRLRQVERPGAGGGLA
mmetsp:Transcript_125505/g.390700  ORF Transcript_125505/g.390700 Transcript_125505/m.390700 type:complete len:213 (+) Transcript_125505:1406-2044(+)